MKENKSPGVDGIAPKILKETVEQMCTPLATCLNCHCRRELYLYNGRKQNYSFIQKRFKKQVCKL